MTKNRFREEQIVGMLKEHEARAALAWLAVAEALVVGSGVPAPA